MTQGSWSPVAGSDPVGDAIAEGYRRIPPATPDGWSSLEELAELATLELMQRLAAEEGEAGFDPW